VVLQDQKLLIELRALVADLQAQVGGEAVQLAGATTGEAVFEGDPIARYEATITAMQLEVAHILDEADQVGTDTPGGQALITDARNIAQSMESLHPEDTEQVAAFMAFIKSARRARAIDVLPETRA
jgi:hypothetical protein